jgi:hypothetical protein
VSETTTESVASSFALARIVVSKFGLPISSSSSHRKRMFTGAPCETA